MECVPFVLHPPSHKGTLHQDKVTEMLERRKSFNSSLHNISKKRLAEMESGIYTPKRQKPIKSISNKARKRIKDYRAACFERWGHSCFLCGRIDETGKTLDCHHIFGRVNGDDVEYIVPLCNRYSGLLRRLQQTQQSVLGVTLG